MKKIIVLLLCLVLTAGALSGCGSKDVLPAGGEGGAIRIVVTIFPIYDWVCRILGETGTNAALTMLMDSGVDLHSYQPPVDDVIRLSNCDLLIYVGGASDGWVEGALAGTVNTDMRVIKLLDVPGVAAKEEELIEGMEAEDGEADTDDLEYDEHVWLSLRNARTVCAAIADALSELDPDNAGAYAENLRTYDAALADLDREYESVIQAAPRRVVLFGDRFPFRYLADDYGLSYYAAFAGCSAETEASFETIVFLAEKVDELGLDTILRIETSTGDIAQTIRENTRTKDQQILVLDSMQGITAADAARGVTYLSVMRDDLEVLRAALGG